MRIQTPKMLGLYMRDRRVALKLSQAELARRIEVSRQWIIEVEQGKPRAEIGLVLKALDALGLIVDVREPSTAGIGRIESSGPPHVDIGEILRRARGADPRPPLTFTDSPRSAAIEVLRKAAPPKSPKRREERGGSG